MHLISRLAHRLQLQLWPVNDLVARIFQTSGHARASRMLDCTTLVRTEATEYQFLCDGLSLSALVRLMAATAATERRSVLFQLLA